MRRRTTCIAVWVDMMMYEQSVRGSVRGTGRARTVGGLVFKVAGGKSRAYM